MTQRCRAALVGILAALLGGLTLPAPAEAQYFGRNQVKYESFNFEVLQTEHFDVYYYPSERVAAEAAARMAERWYHRLSTVLRHELNGRQPLVLYATAPEFQQTNVVAGISEGTGGVTEALRRRIVLPIGGTLRDLDHVLGHELVHAFQYDITGGGGPNTYGAMPGATALPLWFIEGMAEYLSLGSSAPLTAMWMRGAMEDTLPSYRDLAGPALLPLPLRASAAGLRRRAVGRPDHGRSASRRGPQPQHRSRDPGGAGHDPGPAGLPVARRHLRGLP